MANVNLSQESYVDYVGTLFFNALNVERLKFSPKIAEVEGVKVPLIHVSGVQKSSGVMLNFDLWPRNEATEEDVAKMPESITDIEFRIGYWPSIDENGNTVLREGTPKWLAYYNGEKRVVLSGEKRAYNR